MTTTRYFCGFLLALMLAAGILVPVLPAWTQTSDLPEPTAPPVADLSIQKFDFPPDTVAVGEPLLYSLEVANNQVIPRIENTVTNVVVEDDLPDNTRFLSALPGSECTDKGNVVTCELGDIPSNEVRMVEFFVCPTEPGTARNTATVSSDAVVDPNPGNNSAEETTEVTEPAVAGGGCNSQDPQPSPPQDPQPSPPSDSDGAANNGPANNGPANNGPASNGPANNGPANNGAPEIAQETEQEAESGNIEQSFEVS